MSEDKPQPSQPEQYPQPQPGSGLPADFYKVLAETGSLDQAMGKGNGKPKG
jgi:hypothetical protein